MLKLSPTLVVISLMVAFGANAFALEETSEIGKEGKKVEDVKKAVDGKENLPSVKKSTAADNVAARSFSDGTHLIPTDVLKSPHFVSTGDGADIIPIMNSLAGKNSALINFYAAVVKGLAPVPATVESQKEVRQLAMFLDAGSPEKVMKYAISSNVSNMVKFVSTYKLAAGKNFGGAIHEAAQIYRNNPNLEPLDALEQGMKQFLTKVKGYSETDASALSKQLVRDNLCFGQAA